MTFGNDFLYICPSCGKNMYQQTYNSYTVFNSSLYSDGYRTGRPNITGNPAKCPHCGNLFFLDKLKGKELKRYSKKDLQDDWQERKYIEKPNLKDLINAEKQGLAKTEKEENQLRFRLWWAFNDKCRRPIPDNESPLNKRETSIYEKNCKALLQQLPAFLALKLKEQIKKSKNKDKENDDDYINLQFTIAELYRNIGNFEECMKIIKTLPKSYDWLKKQFAKKCKEQNRFVFVIKPKKEKKAKKENFDDLPQV